jgi:hypothetical protein
LFFDVFLIGHDDALYDKVGHIVVYKRAVLFDDFGA